MSIGLMCWNIVEAQGRVRLATVVEFFTSWLLVIPLSYVFTYVFEFNLVILPATFRNGTLDEHARTSNLCCLGTYRRRLLEGSDASKKQKE